MSTGTYCNSRWESAPLARVDQARLITITSPILRSCIRKQTTLAELTNLQACSPVLAAFAFNSLCIRKVQDALPAMQYASANTRNFALIARNLKIVETATHDSETALSCLADCPHTLMQAVDCRLFTGVTVIAIGAYTSRALSKYVAVEGPIYSLRYWLYASA